MLKALEPDLNTQRLFTPGWTIRYNSLRYHAFWNGSDDRIFQNSTRSRTYVLWHLFLMSLRTRIQRKKTDTFDDFRGTTVFASVIAYIQAIVALRCLLFLYPRPASCLDPLLRWVCIIWIPILFRQFHMVGILESLENSLVRTRQHGEVFVYNRPQLLEYCNGRFLYQHLATSFPTSSGQSMDIWSWKSYWFTERGAFDNTTRKPFKSLKWTGHSWKSLG